MGSLIGSFCAGICCSACRQCEGQKFGVISRVPYMFLFFTAGVFSIVMSLYGTKALNLEFYTASICNSSTCTGNGSVYRVSFMLFIFELIHVFVIGAGVVSFHWLWFIIKFITFTACLSLTFILGDSVHSNAFFQGYADYFARFVSGIYLFLQVLIFISYGHKVNEYLQEQGNDVNAETSISESKRSKSIDTESRNNSCNKYFFILGLITFVLYVISLTLCGLFFKWYALDKSCTFNKLLISLTIIMILINFTISAVRGDGSLFVSAIVSFYITFLCLSALQTTKNETCNVFAGYRSSVSLWIGFIFLFISIFYAAFTADRIGVLWEKNDDEYILMDGGDNIDMSLDDKWDKKSIKKQKNNYKKSKEEESSYDDHDIVDDDDNQVSIQIQSKTSSNEPSKRTQRISNTYFHFILTLASCYFAMLLSDWGVGTILTSSGKQSMAVNIATQYATILLFWWTLLAPVICPARFKQNVNVQE